MLAVYCQLDFHLGMTGGLAAADAALVVFSLGGILPLLALLCSSPHGRHVLEQEFVLLQQVR